MRRKKETCLFSITSGFGIGALSFVRLSTLLCKNGTFGNKTAKYRLALRFEVLVGERKCNN